MIVDFPDSPAPIHVVSQPDLHTRARFEGHPIQRTQQQNLDRPIHDLSIGFDSPLDAGISLESLLVRLDGF